MTDTVQTLADVFSGQTAPEAPLDLFAREDIEATAEQGLIENVEAAQNQIGALIAPAINELLDIPISRILGNAWRKLHALRDYAHGDKLNSGETYDFPLAKHSITSTHAPRVALYIKDHKIAEAQVDIELKLLIAQAVLKIKRGHIQHIQVSGLTVSGQISSHGMELTRLERSDLAQEVSFDLEDGIKIPAQDS